MSGGGGGAYFQSTAIITNHFSLAQPNHFPRGEVKGHNTLDYNHTFCSVMNTIYLKLEKWFPLQGELIPCILEFQQKRIERRGDRTTDL